MIQAADKLAEFMSKHVTQKEDYSEKMKLVFFDMLAQQENH